MKTGRETNIEHVIKAIEKAKRDKIGCALLIGAGCSVSAGIPTAKSLVKEILEMEDFFHLTKGLSEDEKTYPKCMGILPPMERHKLINKYVEKLEINWSAIGMSQLIKNGYVDRVLTTNFDPVISRACALSGIHPATYDLAASDLFIPGVISGSALFHLHGLNTGFIQLHTEDQCNNHSKHLRPVFDNTGSDRLWIVVGYSGDNDPVFEQLVQFSRFGTGLFWICFKEDEPPNHVTEKLLLDDKYAFYVQNYDSDSFFTTITQKLGLFPIDFVEKPFSYLKKTLKTIAPYSLPGQESTIDILTSTFVDVDSAIRQFEEKTTLERAIEEPSLNEHDRFKKMQQSFMSGDYDKAISLKPENPDEVTPEIADTLYWAHIFKGNNFEDGALKEDEEKADELYSKAYEQYDTASRIKSDDHVALNSWGNALSGQAKTKKGDAADKLYEEAYRQYEAALKIYKDNQRALYNWGNALFWQAKTKKGDAADKLYEEAYRKYEAALKINPNIHMAIGNWGLALYNQAKTKTGEAAAELLRKSCEKSKAAVKIYPDAHEALVNWGLALYEQAKTETGEAAAELLRNSCEKYEAAIKIKPDSHQAFNNWAAAIFEQAKTETGEVADEFFMKSYEKYEAAIKIKPDYYEPLNNWACTLIYHSSQKVGAERNNLLLEAEKKCIELNKMRHGAGSCGLAGISALLGKADECRKWLEDSRIKGYLEQKADIEQDRDFDSVRNEQWFKDFMASLK